MPDWVITILQPYGLAGVVIAGLAFSNYIQWKAAGKVNAGRLSERDVLITTLESVKNVIKDNVQATKDRNDVTDRLSQAITTQGVAFSAFVMKNEMQNDHMKETITDMKAVISAFSESNRVNNGTLREIRDVVLTADRNSR